MNEKPNFGNVASTNCWLPGNGQTGATWCATNQIKENQLLYWLDKFSSKDSSKKSSSTFIPAVIHDSINSTHHTDYPLVIWVGQATIELKQGFGAELLQDVVHALARLGWAISVLNNGYIWPRDLRIYESRWMSLLLFLGIFLSLIHSLLVSLCFVIERVTKPTYFSGITPDFGYIIADWNRGGFSGLNRLGTRPSQ